MPPEEPAPPDAAVEEAADEHGDAEMTEALGEQSEEGRLPRRAVSPLDPSESEVEDHRLTGHAVFRSWCPHCVRGRGRDDPHAEGPLEDAIPVISWDYCYLASRGPAGGDAAADDEAAEQAGQSPVLVRWDRKSRGLAGYVLPSKGVDFEAADLVVNYLVKDVEALGYKRVCFRSDNEPALLALLRAVRQRLTCEVVLESASEGDPRSNGAAEMGVRLLKGLVRTLKDALEARLGKAVPASHGLITWMVRYASSVYCRYTVGRDGRTPHERLTGRKFRGAVAEFGEAVWWMPLQPHGCLPPLGARFEPGWYLGPVEGQAQSYIMTETGVVRTRTIRRRPPRERWAASELLEKGTATVLQPNALRPGEARIGIRAPIHLPEPVGLPPPPREPGERQVRRARLQRADFLAHGYTPDCHGCENIRGGSRIAIAHSERCRERMEALLAQSDAGRRRLEEAERRAARAGRGPEPDEAKRRRVDEEQPPSGGAAASPAAPTSEDADMNQARGPGGAEEAEAGPSTSSSSTAAPSLPAAGTMLKRDGSDGIESDAKRQRRDAGALEDDTAECNAVDLLLIWSGLHGPHGAVCEVYSPPRVASVAETMGETAGWSLDLTTCDEQGRAWDFDDPACRRRAVQLVRQSRPFMLIGSPMCTWFSTLMSMNFPQMTEEQKEQGMARARRHLAFSIYLYRIQLQEGRHFLHEHPAGASSWKDECVTSFMRAHPGLYTTVSHMCRFGMQSTLEDRVTMAPVAKPTRWLTSSRHVAEALNRRCLGGHRHAVLVSGRASAAQVYPKALCQAIVKGIAAQRAEDETKSGCSLAPLCIPCHRAAEAPTFTLDLLRLDPDDDGNLEEEEDEDGGFREDEWEAEDDVRGGSLPSRLVHRARLAELDYLRSREVYEYSSVEEARRVTGKPPLKLKWIDTNKGGRDLPEVRSRLVCTEVRRRDQVPIFSATPPLETLRTLVARLASEDPAGQADPYKAVHIDVSRAHFYATAVRDVYIELPGEDPKSQIPGACGKLRKTMYGTLDAAERWGEHYAEVLRDAGFTRGRASPCHFWCKEHELWVLVHGDDFFGIARAAGRKHLVDTLRAHYEIKVKEAGPQAADPKELMVIGRILSFRPDGVTLEADPCHAEQAIEELGLGSAKGVSTPSVPDATPGPKDLSRRRRDAVWRRDGADGAGAGDEEEDLDPRLVGPALVLYQSVAARLNYYALDRPDLQYPVKELMRKMSCPTSSDMIRLKRVGRYLLTAPRVAMFYPWTALADTVTVFTDSDHAGCQRTRKSTAGGVAMWGAGVIKTWSKTLPVIALSTGESELAASVRAAAEGIGLQTLLADFGVEVSVVVESDATAAIGMCRRLGLGKVRHLATADLWIQQRVKAGQISLKKLPGKVNPSDLLTKHKSRDECLRLMKLMQVLPLAGRAACAPLRATSARPPEAGA